MARPDIETLRALELILRNQDEIMRIMSESEVIKTSEATSTSEASRHFSNASRLAHRRGVTDFAIERLGELCNQK